MYMEKLNKALQGMMSYLFIILGALMASFSVACILLPNDAIDYGTAGIGIIISKLTGLDLSIAVIITFVPFVLAGFFLLGVKFSIKALVGSVAYTVGLEILRRFRLRSIRSISLRLRSAEHCSASDFL